MGFSLIVATIPRLLWGLEGDGHRRTRALATTRMRLLRVPSLLGHAEGD